MPIEQLPERFRSSIRLICTVLLLLVHPAGHADPPGHAAVDARLLIPRLYASGQQPSWLAGGQARLALRILRDAPAHGLDPALYGVEDLARRLDSLSDAASAAAFERELSTAMLQYLADLHFGRLASAYRSASALSTGFDPVAQLADAAKRGGLQEAVAAAAPAIPLYRRVQATLAGYRALASLYPSWPSLPSVPHAGLRPGDRYEGAAMLRERLSLLGDLDRDAMVPTVSDVVYAPELAAAVRRFQARHGLAEDGVLGAQTRAALSVPLRHRVAQLALTLERLRWLPPLRPGRIVAVNLPSYRLWAFDTRSGASVAQLEMRVIVGTAARTPTPLFIGEMRSVEVNPYWNVPRSIVMGEIIPKLGRDPAYLRKNNMELVSPAGAVLPDGAVDPLALLRGGQVRARQRPGAGNVLGTLKFAMPNPMNIYLHSTSAQELFDRTRRDLSHGCIRVEHPIELAQFVLGDAGTWDAEKLDAEIRSGRTRGISLPAPVPVILFYATAVSDRHGRAIFADDIYGRDAGLLRALGLSNAGG